MRWTWSCPMDAGQRPLFFLSFARSLPTTHPSISSPSTFLSAPSSTLSYHPHAWIVHFLPSSCRASTFLHDPRFHTTHPQEIYGAGIPGWQARALASPRSERGAYAGSRRTGSLGPPSNPVERGAFDPALDRQASTRPSLGLPRPPHPTVGRGRGASVDPSENPVGPSQKVGYSRLQDRPFGADRSVFERSEARRRTNVRSKRTKRTKEGVDEQHGRGKSRGSAGDGAGRGRRTREGEG